MSTYLNRKNDLSNRSKILAKVSRCIFSCGIAFAIVSVLLGLIIVGNPRYIDRHDSVSGFGIKHPIMWRYQKHERSGSYRVTRRPSLFSKEEVYVYLYFGRREIVGLQQYDVDIDLVMETQVNLLLSRFDSLSTIERDFVSDPQNELTLSALFQDSEANRIRLTVRNFGDGNYGVAQTYYGSSDKLNQEADMIANSMYFSIYSPVEP